MSDNWRDQSVVKLKMYFILQILYYELMISFWSEYKLKFNYNP
jgi:hypothetical protein